jgi:hypothetical protein
MRDRSRIVGYSYLKRLWKSRPSLADSSFWLGPPADLTIRNQAALRRIQGTSHSRKWECTGEPAGHHWSDMRRL